MAGILTLMQLSTNPEPFVPNTTGAAGLTQSALATYKVAGIGMRLGQPGSAALRTDRDSTKMCLLVNWLGHWTCTIHQAAHAPEPVEPDRYLPDTQHKKYCAGQKECRAEAVTEFREHCRPLIVVSPRRPFYALWD